MDVRVQTDELTSYFVLMVKSHLSSIPKMTPYSESPSFRKRDEAGMKVF